MRPQHLWLGIPLIRALSADAYMKIGVTKLPTHIVPIKSFALPRGTGIISIFMGSAEG